MKRKFKSKIGLLIILTSLFAIGLPFYLDGLNWKAVTSSIIPSLLLLPLLLKTHYTIKDNDLLIRCGFLFWEISIADITSITKTKSWLSAPALSLDRLEISYKNNSRIIVSPGDKTGFIEALKEVNNKISFFDSDLL